MTMLAELGLRALYHGESADENPSDFGAVDFVATDVTAGSEDTVLDVMLRVAGAALTAAYRFVTTTAFRAIFTHANSADRTYTLPNTTGTVVLLEAENTFTRSQHWAKGADIGSDTTLTPGTDGNYFEVTGAVTITALASRVAGDVILLKFNAALTLTHNATTLILPGAANITTAANDTALFVSLGSGNWRCVLYTRADGQATVRGLTGELTGLGLSNNGTDPTNDVDIAVGAAVSQDTVIANRVLISLTSALTKRLDAAWAVGSGNGGLDTGAIGNGTYGVWLIRRSDTGVVDALFSLGTNSPDALPSGYDSYRRIGCVIRAGGTILAFTQDGDWFGLTASVLDVNTASPGTSAVTATLTVPARYNVHALVQFQAAAASASQRIHLSDLAANDEAPSATAAPLSSAGVVNAASQFIAGRAVVRTNTTSQIRYRVASNEQVYIATLGWWDRRGRG